MCYNTIYEYSIGKWFDKTYFSLFVLPGKLNNYTSFRPSSYSTGLILKTISRYIAKYKL